MKERIRKHGISFRYAFAGLVYAFTTQPNFIVHFILSILAILAALFLKVSDLKMIGLIIMVAIGLAAEMINTAIESITDLVTDEWKREAKIAKDVSAGMVLLTAFSAVIVAIIVLLPPLLQRVGF